MEWKTAVGQDSHRFVPEEGDGKHGNAGSGAPCVLGGIIFPDTPPFLANSDGDVVLHALVRAISGITCREVLGKRADALCRAGITDSSEYLALALRDLEETGFGIAHVSFSIEAKKPAIMPRAAEMRARIASLLGIPPENVGITAMTGEGLTACGRGEGVSVLCVLTACGDGHSPEPAE